MQYLEPRTDVPAKDDWSTGLILRDLRWGARVLGGGAVVTGAFAVTCWLLPSSPGTIGAFVVLALITLVFGLSPLMYRVETRPLRRGLFERPWRRVPAEVLEKHADGTDRLRLEGLVLRGWFEDLPDMALERGEVFVCGPDVHGRAVVRAAGFAKWENAKVDRGKDAETRPVRERVERPLGRPLDDEATARAFRGMRWGERAWLWAAVPAGTGGLLVLLSLFPLAPAGLAVGGTVLVLSLIGAPTAIEISRWYRDAVTAVENSAQWTPVAITLFPWQPHQHVTGLAEMPGGARAGAVRALGPVRDREHRRHRRHVDRRDARQPDRGGRAEGAGADVRRGPAGSGHPEGGPDPLDPAVAAT